ncbi:MAG: hypothetical protein ABI353_05580 [Isosphaeraceae bacterium]
MSRDATAGLFASIVTNRFAEEDGDAFDATIDGLRLELAPTTIFESLWVDMALMAIKRLRTSAMLEDDDSPTDSHWLRYQSMAERSLNNAVKNIEKCRRLAARALDTAPNIPQIPPSPPPVPIPIPEPKAVAPPKETPISPEPPKATDSTPKPPTTDSPEQIAKLKQVIDTTETLGELFGGIDPTLRAEFLEPFREDVVAMLSEGFTPEEIVRGFPGLTLDDIRAFQTGASLPNPSLAGPDPAIQAA